MIQLRKRGQIQIKICQPCLISWRRIDCLTHIVIQLLKMTAVVLCCWPIRRTCSQSPLIAMETGNLSEEQSANTRRSEASCKGDWSWLCRRLHPAYIATDGIYLIRIIYLSIWSIYDLYPSMHGLIYPRDPITPHFLQSLRSGSSHTWHKLIKYCQRAITLASSGSRGTFLFNSC